MCVCMCVTPFYAYCNFLTMQARVLKFHIWIPHGKIAGMYFFFFSKLCCYLELIPPLKNGMEILLARYLKHYLSWALIFGVLLIGAEE